MCYDVISVGVVPAYGFILGQGDSLIGTVFSGVLGPSSDLVKRYLYK